MILLSLDAGLRYDGCQNKTISNFNNHAKLWKIKDNRIIHLAHSVIEKKDLKAYTYKIHFKEIPKLCALRHLLVYTHCTKFGNNDSQFFPTNIQPSDGYDESFDAEEMYTPLNYKDLYHWLIKKIQESCEHVSEFRAGTHTLRRTFYQFAAICIAVHKQENEIAERVLQQHARHKDINSASHYLGDCRLIARTIAEDPEMMLKNPVPKF